MLKATSSPFSTFPSSKDDNSQIQIQSQPQKILSDNLNKLRKNRFFSIILISFGIILGSYVTSFFMKRDIYLSVNRHAIYEKDYRESPFFTNTPAAKGSDPFDVEKTIERLFKHFPKYTDGPTGEKNIIQMWKKKPEDCEYGEFPNLKIYEKWSSSHPTFNFTFYTNKEVDKIIKRTFINTVPEVWEAYRLLPKVILQSDFGRYILIFLEGGTYSDIDVDPLQPIDKWMDNIIDDEVNMVVGVESDPNKENWAEIMPRRVQFLQWTFKARKRHPAMARVIANIVKTTFEAHGEDKMNAYFNEFKDDVDKCKSVDVMDWTGPGTFTDSIYQHFNKIKNLNIVYLSPVITNQKERIYGPDSVPGEIIDWKTFTGVWGPTLVDDILVLPRRGFRAASDCPNLCYVSHGFSGSWKSGNVR